MCGFAGIVNLHGGKVYPSILDRMGEVIRHRGPDDSGQFIFTRTDKRLTPQGSVSAINIVNLGCKHTLTPSLSAVATISDLFNGQRYQRFVSTPTFTQVYERGVAGRIAFVGLTYTVGGTKKDNQSTFEFESGG